MKKILLIVALFALSGIASAQQVTSGGGGAKTNALTTLTPSSAGALDIGSSSKWFQDIYFGHSGSFYAKAIITPTANRTITFPDATITVAGSASALTSGRVPFATTGGLLTDSANLTFSGSALTLSSAVIANSAGSAGAPAYSFSSASNFGMYMDGSGNLLDFSVNGQRVLYLGASEMGWLPANFSMGGWFELVANASGGVGFGSGHKIVWGSSSTNSGVTGDTSWKRLSAGVLKASDGSTGAGAIAVGTDASPCKISGGSGSPEGAVTGNVCDLWLRTDGSTSTTLYIKTSGTGNTGWTAK